MGNAVIIATAAPSTSMKKILEIMAQSQLYPIRTLEVEKRSAIMDQTHSALLILNAINARDGKKTTSATKQRELLDNVPISMQQVVIPQCQNTRWKTRTVKNKPTHTQREAVR